MTLATRLMRLERQWGTPMLAERQRREARHVYAQMLLSLTPDLGLVEPCDTDAETFCRIRLLIAEAANDWDAADAWGALLPPLEPDLDEPGSAELVQRIAEEVSTKCRKSSEAVEAARARLGIERGG